MLYKGIYDPSISQFIPNTIEKTGQWKTTKTPLPNDEIYQTLAHELKHLATTKKIGQFAQHFNHLLPQSGQIIKKTGRELKNINFETIKQYQLLLSNIDLFWQKPAVWQHIKHNTNSWTSRYYLNALDYKVQANGDYQKQKPNQQIYLPTLGKTLWVAFIITWICILLGYPVAYYLTTLKKHRAGFALLFILLPFWTSFLVRTTAWITILQTEGIVNKTLLALHLINQPLELLYNQFAMIIAMVHILLPFMILPLYSVMKNIDHNYIKASYSLGAGYLTSFWRVYLPLSLPGLAAGSLLVFIISLGYYITPALLGGVDGQLISSLIALHMRETNNWELASALSGILLFVVILLYLVFDKRVGLQSLKF